MDCHEILLSVVTYPIHFSFPRKLWLISIIGIMRMSKSKAELPSTDVLVNPQRPDGGTQQRIQEVAPLSTKAHYDIRHRFLLKKLQTLCCEHKKQ